MFFILKPNTLHAFWNKTPYSVDVEQNSVMKYISHILICALYQMSHSCPSSPSTPTTTSTTGPKNSISTTTGSTKSTAAPAMTTTTKPPKTYVLLLCHFMVADCQNHVTIPVHQKSPIPTTGSTNGTNEKMAGKWKHKQKEGNINEINRVMRCPSKSFQ